MYATISARLFFDFRHASLAVCMCTAKQLQTARTSFCRNRVRLQRLELRLHSSYQSLRYGRATSVNLNRPTLAGGSWYRCGFAFVVRTYGGGLRGSVFLAEDQQA